MDPHHAQNLYGVTAPPAPNFEIPLFTPTPSPLRVPSSSIAGKPPFPWQERIKVLEHHQVFTFLSLTSHAELRHFSYSWSQTFVQLTTYVRLLIGEQVNMEAESASGGVPGVGSSYVPSHGKSAQPPL